MNSLELRKQVTELKRKKKINEQNVPGEELNGKYKVPYERLCAELRQRQAELKTSYIEAIRNIAEILTEAVYADPDEEYEIMHRKFVELDAVGGGNPVLQKVMQAIFFFEEEG